MRTAKEYKMLFEQIPDNAPVSLGDNWECDIVGWGFDTTDGIAKLKLTEGCSITTNEFLDGLFKSFKDTLNKAAQVSEN